ncbi:hypothetical protein J5N97_006363 [Dioscorea zingiberensis]|uniref:Cytochrome P450 n=1 Tax=Dioscorea zingiberensis TaxID=325984 RepID=A0A9D5HTY5_9LILI|nr:hypothetical protein J5N97_006363 [Dioscorea zingiberensis]
MLRESLSDNTISPGQPQPRDPLHRYSPGPCVASPPPPAAVEVSGGLKIPAVSVFLLIKYLKSNGKSSEGNRLPPGYMGLPFIGETFSFLKPHSATILGEFMDHHIARFGKIFTANILGEKKVISTDAEFNWFVLKNDKKLFEQGWPSSFVQIIGKNSLSMLAGDDHKSLRSIIFNFLNGERLRTAFLDDAEQVMSLLMSSWKDGSLISAKNEAIKFSFYVMIKEILNVDPGEPEMDKLMREYNELIKGIAAIPLNLPGTSYWKALKRKMEEREKNGDENPRILERYDLLNWLMKNTAYGLEEIGDTLLQTLFGGHDTTSRAICLMVYFLDDCPRAVQQLREEHLHIVKKKEEREESKLRWDDFKAMEFTKCVINETLRLGNIAGFIYKKSSREIEFKDYVIPHGCTVITHFSAVHLDPNLFENPTHFDPWRWMGSSDIKMKNFMPFGGGPRLCPGAELSRMEMMVFLHHLLLNYSWELAEPDHPISLPFC